MASATPPNTSAHAIHNVATRAGSHGTPMATTPAITRTTPAAMDQPLADLTSRATLPTGPAISAPPPAIAGPRPLMSRVRGPTTRFLAGTQARVPLEGSRTAVRDCNAAGGRLITLAPGRAARGRSSVG